jgi:hypothetical protein
MVQHVLERGFDRNAIVLVDVRVRTRANDAHLQGAAGRGRVDEFCGTHVAIIPLLPFASCETV